MRQILLRKSDKLKPNPANPGTVRLFDSGIVLRPGQVNSVRITGAIEVLSGTPRFRFSVPKALAARGAFLLGAYYDAGEVVAYFNVIEGQDAIEVRSEEDMNILDVESDALDVLTLVEGDARFSGGVIRLDLSSAPADAPLEPIPGKKRPRKGKR